LAKLFEISVDVLLDSEMEDSPNEKISASKMPWIFIGISTICILAYLITSIVLGWFSGGTLICMFVIYLPIQLFLHIYFSNAIHQDSFHGIAGFDDKIEYHIPEVKKLLVQMDLHIFNVDETFGGQRKLICESRYLTISRLRWMRMPDFVKWFKFSLKNKCGVHIIRVKLGIDMYFLKEVLVLATSSITKNFVVSGVEQVEKFANAIEESYQESLKRAPEPDMKITHLRGTDEVKKFMAKRKMTND
jgi:hypothetical protein